MQGPDGIDLGAAIGPTDRGSLWRASRDREHDRVVRIVDPRFCDERFKHALRNLQQRRHPQLLPIAGEGWSGAHYYIEYEIEPPWQTLEERLADCGHWRDRMAVLQPVCDVFELWRRSPVHPLGLNLRNVVLTDPAGAGRPWLVPCPAVTVSSPCDLFGLDTTVVAALPPETIRGVELNQRAQDVYALGTLAAQAAGCAEARFTRDDESRVAAQARGGLLVPTPDRSGIAPFLHATPQMQQLFRTIRHYRHNTPDARPHDAGELRSALAAATDPVALAAAVRPTDPGRALELLRWVGDSDPAQYVGGLRLAAEIEAEAGNWAAALKLLDRAVATAPDDLDLRRHRCDARWQAFQLAAASGTRYREDDLLLQDLELVKSLDPATGSTPYLRAVEVYRRRGDLGSVANELYDAAELDPTNLQILLQYAACWLDLHDRATAAAVRDLARRRISGMVDANVISRREGELWNDDFDRLFD